MTFRLLIPILVALSLSGLAVPSKTDHLTPQATAAYRVPEPPPPLPEPQNAAWAAILLARPLFNPARRPPQPPPPAAAILPPLPRLTGTMVGPFGKRALFAGSDGGKVLAVGESGAVGPWTVTAVTTGTVTVIGPGGRRELHVVSDGHEPGLVDVAVSLSEAASPWTNPCSRLHQRSGEQPIPPRNKRCALTAATTATK